MSSILRIFLDIQCLIYCDLELASKAIPDSILRLHILFNYHEDNSLL